MKHVIAPDGEMTYPKVKRIYLYENKISDVEHMLTVGHVFPRLQNLVLADNPIEVSKLSYCVHCSSTDHSF